jgi:uncharacterized membrane protein
VRSFVARIVFSVAALWLIVGIARGAENGASPSALPAGDGARGNPSALAVQVREIFAVKCVECHDDATARARGDFGYVLDLARVAANRDWVVPGDGEKSELYLLVKSEEMPGDEASAPPLTAAEKETVKRWIDQGAATNGSPAQKESNLQGKSGAETAEAVSDLSTAPGMTGSKSAIVGGPSPAEAKAAVLTAAPTRRILPFGQRLIRALGQFHPPSSHFPIALLIAACPAEFMWLRTRKGSWKAVVRFCVMLGAISAAATAALGWCDAAFSNYTGASASVLAWHRWIGTATAGWAAVMAAVSEVAHRTGQPPRWRRAFRAILFVGIALVSVAGYLGAALIYGLRHFSW